MTETCVRSAVEEPLPGTAPAQTHWLFVEAPGRWGRDALADCSLPTADREALQRLPEQWRIVLVRHRDRPLRSQQDRFVWLSTPSAEPKRWLLDVAAPVQPDRLGPGEPVGSEVLFVCCNGSRDRCCAVDGRELLGQLPGEAWECSHLGGHRFAPTAVRLSDRVLFGSLTADSGRRVLAGEAPAGHVRGPAGWPAAVQAAAAAVWRQHPYAALAGAQVAGPVARLTLADGSKWEVTTSTVPVAARRTSCRADPEPGAAHTAGEPVRMPSAWGGS